MSERGQFAGRSTFLTCDNGLKRDEADAGTAWLSPLSGAWSRRLSRIAGAAGPRRCSQPCATRSPDGQRRWRTPSHHHVWVFQPSPVRGRRHARLLAEHRFRPGRGRSTRILRIGVWYGPGRVLTDLSVLRFDGEGSGWPSCRGSHGRVGERAAWYHHRREVGASLRGQGRERSPLAVPGGRVVGVRAPAAVSCES